MKNYLYETAVLLCLALLPGSGASAQERSALRTAGPRFAVRTNALYWATASLNAGFEVGLDPRTSWEVAGGYNPWTFGDNRKLKFWTARRPNSATGSAGVSPGIFSGFTFSMPTTTPGV